MVQLVGRYRQCIRAAMNTHNRDSNIRLNNVTANRHSNNLSLRPNFRGRLYCLRIHSQLT